ncbi:MAG: nucleotidyltransferase domain-containing protein [Aquificaceae bacterium]
MEAERYFELIGRTIERALRKDCLIIFFGSAVRENFGRASDIDVALFCSEPLSFTEYSRLLSEIEELPILRDVDLVDLWRVDSYDFLSKILEEGLFWKSSEELMRLLRRRLEGLRKSEVKTS